MATLIKSPEVETKPPEVKALEVKVVEELERIPYEPLLPVEIKLIAWSLVLGFVLLGLLIWVSYTFFVV